MEWKDIIEYLGMVPQAVWGSIGTLVLGGFTMLMARIRKGSADQRKVLYRNLLLLMSRDKGWTGVANVNKITFGTNVVIDWIGGDDKVVIQMGGADQASLLYDHHRKDILAKSKAKLTDIVEDQIQNRAAGVNMMVGSLAAQV